MILSSIAMCVASLLLGAFVAYLIMKAENRSDRNEHREAYAEAKIREHNAEAVAQTYVNIKNSLHDALTKYGNVQCCKCGRFVKYIKAFHTHNDNTFVCRKCLPKSEEWRIQNHV